MLELVFVIVIMGILAKFGVDLIKQTYENYARTVALASLEEKTENAILQISNRLRERIPDSVIVSASGNSIQWVGKDIDGWSDGSWSGLADLLNPSTNANNIVSPGTADIFSANSNNYALYFVQNDFSTGASTFYGAAGPMHPITNFTGTNTLVFGTGIAKASEHYVIARYAYNLDFTAASGNLNLTRSTPWNGNVTATFLLADHVDNFFITNYQEGGGGFIVHLCISSNNFLGEDYSICKQKFIF